MSRPFKSKPRTAKAGKRERVIKDEHAWGTAMQDVHGNFHLSARRLFYYRNEAVAQAESMRPGSLIVVPVTVSYRKKK